MEKKVEKFNLYYEYAHQQDEKDQLRKFQDHFQPISKNIIYFQGGSLGRLPKKTKFLLDKCLFNQWRDQLSNSYKEWMELPVQSAKIISKLINVKQQEVCICDNTSTNLYKLAFGALMNSKRSIVLLDQYNFPTDLYIIQGLCDHTFSQKKVIKLSTQEGKFALDLQTIKKNLTQDVALLILGHTLYKSSYVYDMKQINKLADQKGVMVLWDISHSVGSVPLYLNQWNCKMAVGCTYKFLNAGAGAPSFIYLEKDLIKKIQNPIKGWLGHASPFSFQKNYKPKQQIQKFWSGSLSVLSSVGIIPGIQVILQAGIQNIRKKSLSLSKLLIKILNQELQNVGFKLQSPKQQEKRGSSLTLSHPKAEKIKQKLQNQKSGRKICLLGFKPPCHLRIGLVSLYNTHKQVVQFCQMLLQICKELNSQESFQQI